MRRGRSSVIATRFRVFVSLAMGFASACTSRDVRIVAGTNDSLVVNNRLPISLPVYAVDVRGRRHPIAGLRYQQIGGDPISLGADGRVTCVRRADARVRVWREQLTTTFSLLCRPILSVGIKRLWVFAGGDSAALDPVATAMDGDHEPLIAGIAVVQDTSIAYVDHGKVFGRRPGETNVIVTAGDCTDWTRVEVNERVATSLGLARFQVFVGGPVELAPGELRVWRVAPGPYEIWTGDDAEGGFAFGTANINCADGVRAGQYSCRALANGAVIVRNMRRAGSVRGTVLVSRKLDPDRDSAYVRVHPLSASVPSADHRQPPGWCNPRLRRK